MRLFSHVILSAVYIESSKYELQLCLFVIDLSMYRVSLFSDSKTSKLQAAAHPVVSRPLILSEGISEKRQLFISRPHITLTATDQLARFYNGLAGALGKLAQLQTDSFLLHDNMSV